MTKKDFIASVTARCHKDISRETVEAVLNAYAEVVTNNAIENTEIPILGIGKFVVKNRPARGGCNPATGAFVNIPASKVINLRLSKAFKESINK